MNTEFLKYKDIHNGKRVFIIANGPSLADTDLNPLKNEITIAMNKISLIYDKNPDWKPTYYLFSSTNVNHPDWGDSWTKAVRDSIKHKETTGFIAKQFKNRIDPKNKYENVYWFKDMSEHKPDQQGNIKQQCFSTNVVERIDKSGSTINLALQLSYFMGFNEVVLVGADLGWTKDLGSKSDPNHFDKSYRANISNPEKANNQMRNVHSLAYKKFNERDYPVKFYNATLRTKLDVYPIIDYNEYVNNSNVVYLNEKQKEAEDFWLTPHQYKD